MEKRNIVIAFSSLLFCCACVLFENALVLANVSKPFTILDNFYVSVTIWKLFAPVRVLRLGFHSVYNAGF